MLMRGNLACCLVVFVLLGSIGARRTMMRMPWVVFLLARSNGCLKTEPDFAALDDSFVQALGFAPSERTTVPDRMTCTARVTDSPILATALDRTSQREENLEPVKANHSLLLCPLAAIKALLLVPHGSHVMCTGAESSLTHTMTHSDELIEKNRNEMK